MAIGDKLFHPSSQIVVTIRSKEHNLLVAESKSASLLSKQDHLSQYKMQATDCRLSMQIEYKVLNL